MSERRTKRRQQAEDDSALRDRLAEVSRVTGHSWRFSRQKNRRYSLLCDVDRPPLTPGGPMVFVRDLTALQLSGVVNAMHYALTCRATRRREDDGSSCPQ